MTIKSVKYSALIILLLATFSCTQDDLEETTIESIAAVEEAKTEKLIFTETFESPVPLYTAHGTDFSTPHAFSVVSAPVYRGLKSARFELRDTDPMISGGTRSEVTVVKEPVQKEMWYSFAVYFPAEGFAKDAKKELISQWHQGADKHLGEESQSPATQLVIKNDRFILDTGFNGEQVAREVIRESRKRFDLGLVTKDSWHEFVFHFIHSYEADGLLEVWHNGQKLLSHTGGNMFNNVELPRWKIGIYKWKWNGSGITDTKTRVLYYDNIKVGGQQVSLDDMAPSQSPGVIKDPTPLPINTLTFVNSHTDADIRMVAEADVLHLNSLGTTKVNIRANTDAAKTGSVRFELRGKKKYSYIDKTPPYALFGDDGQGNYYYTNTFLPKGNYTLEVTPYSDTKAKGVAGQPYKISFTIAH